MTSPPVVIPLFNERGNIAPPVREVVHHLRGRVAFDILCVDDPFEDDTRSVLATLESRSSRTSCARTPVSLRAEFHNPCRPSSGTGCISDASSVVNA